jgi:hypothetical protein
MAAGSGVAAAAPSVRSQLFVSRSGSTGSPDSSCRTAAYDTIGAAVAAAPGGSQITVCPGTYAESVTVTGKSLQLISQGATISVPDTPSSQGVVFMGPMTAGSSLAGFTITGAQAEGFYADGTSDLTILGNRIIGNDLSCQNATDAAVGKDCGEGLHFDAVTNSRVTGNYLTGNTGGILMTDGVPPGSIGAGPGGFGFTTQYSGPSSGNLIADNRTIDNVWACGITMPSHNSFAANPATGVPDPSAGGVYNNTVIDNVSIGNGTAPSGGGAGILIAAPFPGTASYDNVVKDNSVAGNGLAGITIHSHAPGQDVNGNQISGNIVGQNALDGNSADGGPGDSDFNALGTIGILVGSVTPVTGTVIAGNLISNNNTGIWTTNNVSGDFTHNVFFQDKVAVSNTNTP